jgi:hypothetical protein
MAQCEVCGTELVQGRGRARRTCSAACRQKAHRQRQAGQLAELQAAAAGSALARVPPTTPDVPATDDSPARRIRAAGAALAASIEQAARRAADGWTPHPRSGTDAETWAGVVRVEAAEVAAAILASAPDVSRDEPEPDRAAVPAADVPAGSSRSGPAAAAPAPATPEGPAADLGSSRDEPVVEKSRMPRRKRLSQKAARTIADSARLVKHPEHRENHRWTLIAPDGTVLGHVEPSYGGTSRTGRNGWKYQVAHTFVGGGPHKTREAAAVQCALSWIRLVTAPVRTLTGN